MKVEVKYIPIEELNEYVGNAKIHTEEQVQQIADSIKEFGFNDPIGIDEDGTIVEGHGRYLASKLLNLKEVPTISLHHLSEVQKKAYIIAHNKLTMQTGFDVELLEAEIASIIDEDDSMVGFIGFSEDELNEITRVIDEDVDIQGEVYEEDIPEFVSNPVIQFGDLIEFSDGSRIICGDSTDEKTYDKLMQGNRARMVNTDPPYGVLYTSKKKKDNFDKIINDDLTGDVLEDFLEKCFINLNKHTIANPAMYIFHPYANQMKFENALNKSGFKIKQQLIWKKNNFSIGWSDYHQIHEPIFYAVKKDKNCEYFGDRCSTTLFCEKIEDMEKDELVDLIKKAQENSTVWEISRDSTNLYAHPTQKPVALAERAIRNSSKKDEIVLDPFAGSGSTLIAGFKTGRRVYTIEFEPKYVQVVIQRMVEFSGEEIVCINGKMVNWYDYKGDS